MPENETILNKTEIKWLMEQRITRMTDNKETLLYPMGAERYLALVLDGKKADRYHIKNDIEGKNILVIPGYANNAFLFAEAGAKSITVYDKDPVTIAWIKAFKKYYHYREFNNQGKAYPSIGELLTALTCWYPPRIALPSGTFKNALCWAINPQSLRRTYIFYMLSLVRNALQSKTEKNMELNKEINFYQGELSQLLLTNEHARFDTAFVPYLLGVQNGIEKENDIVHFIKQITDIVPSGHILITPTRTTKEFYVFGQQYFTTTHYPDIQSIPGLQKYYKTEDRYWFKTQGLTIFGRPERERE